MDKKLQDAFEVLRRQHGSHSAVAKHIGITGDHYCALRNGRANMPQRTADYIILKASEVDPCQGAAPPPEQAAEARP